ncbi:MAG: DNA methyltransferase [Planctomycetota bacterium]
MKVIKPEKQVVSKERVADHGEVYTAQREVKAMLDLVKQETERIDSRFLEPACGTGNFLAEVLSRKLNIVENRYGKSQLEYERYSVLAVSSIYGIDILEDNVIECQKRLLDIFNERYNTLYKEAVNEECKKAIKYILEKNIIWGDALSLATVGENPKPIVFTEWSLASGSMIKRRDVTFGALLGHSHTIKEWTFSDLGKQEYSPKYIQEYPLVHFMKITNVEKQ